jgi:hypothetical protein
MSKECCMSLSDCVFEKDVSKVGFVYVNGAEKRCTSGFILSILPDLDIVIHYTVWCPKLVISLKFEGKSRFSLVDVPFYYSKEVLPVKYLDYINFNCDDLEDGDFISNF